MDRLEKANWFSRVGVEDTKEVTLLKSWDDAIASCSTVDWENTTLEASNLVTVQLAVHHQERYMDFRDIANAMLAFTDTLLNQKISCKVSQYKLPKVFADGLRGDITNICTLSEYADICPSVFYDRMAQYYLAGHFPCGWDGPFPYGTDEEFPYDWEGDLPKGKFIIY